MKKTISIIVLLVIFSILISADDRNKNRQNNHSQNFSSLSSKQFNVNLINTWYRNNGSYNRDPSSGNAGFEWPKGSNKHARYASGLWIGGKINNQIRVAIAEYDYEYLSGYTISNSCIPTGKDDPLYRVYTITNPNDPDYLLWPINQGAPNINGQPVILGDMTMFYAYTDSYPESHGNRAGSTLPLNVDVQQTNWAYNTLGPLGNMIFQRFRLINRCNNVIDSMYVSLWTDDDIGSLATSDLVGCDTNRNLGFTYKGISSDPQYPIPPAVGFDFLQGALVDSPGDTARIPDLERGMVRIIPNKKILIMNSYNKYTGGDPTFGDPANYIETFNFMKGRTKTGAQYINPVTGQPTTYVNSGDPESGTGWVDFNVGDRRFMMNTGPFTMMPGDTQDIVTVQIIAAGTSNLNSVTKLKHYSEIAQNLYNNAFIKTPAYPSPQINSYAPDNGKIYLAWDDIPERITIPNIYSQGKYEFEAYSVYYIKPGTTGEKSEDRIQLGIYDRINILTELKDSIALDEYGVIVWTTIYNLPNTGIRRFIVIDNDPLTNKPFIKGTPYKFAVVSIGYDTLANIERGSQKVNTSSIINSTITVIPQYLTQGTNIHYGLGDTIFSSNRRDLGVIPIVFDPLKLTGGNYRTSYSSVNGLSWTLTKGTETLVSNYPDFSGMQDTALIRDGMMMLHAMVRDSGVVKDASDTNRTKKTKFGGWQYNPPQNQWIQGVSSSAVTTAKLFTNRQFQSVEMGFTFPTSNSYRGVATRVKANGLKFTPVNGVLNGGPLRKIKLVFGQTQKAYRYSPGTNVLLTDTLLTNTPYRDYIDIPFSVYAVDELDSSAGAPRQLNAAFVDADDNGVWDPDTTALGKYQVVYILASSYDPNPNTVYTTKNIGFPGSTNFGGFDIMYVWAPRVKTVNGAPMTYQNGDELTIHPYTITRADFVPGYPVYYNFSVDGSIIGNNMIAQNKGDMNRVRLFPNPYYGGHRLESSDEDRFIYFSNLPAVCNVYIYSLNGGVIRIINRNNPDPKNSLEQWDLRNSTGSFVASGMYIAYIDAPGIGSKILKFAVLQ